MSGAIPSCSSWRSTSAPSRNEPTVHPSYAAACSGRTRSATRVITPNAPSEPSTSCRSEGPAAVPGASKRRQRPHGRHALQRHDLRVDPPVPGRGLACRARRGATADRRPLVALRHVPQREPVDAQRGVGLRQPDARLEDRDPRARVDRDQPVQLPEVQRHERAETAALAREPADDARPAAERHDRHALLRTRGQHAGDGRGRRPERRRHPARTRSPPPAGPADRDTTSRDSAARAPRGRRAPRPAPPAANAPQRGNADGGNDDVVERDRRGDHAAVDPDLLAQQLGGVLRQRRPGPRLAPAPEDLLAPHSAS